MIEPWDLIFELRCRILLFYASLNGTGSETINLHVLCFFYKSYADDMFVLLKRKNYVNILLTSLTFKDPNVTFYMKFGKFTLFTNNIDIHE